MDEVGRRLIFADDVILESSEAYMVVHYFNKKLMEQKEIAERVKQGLGS